MHESIYDEFVARAAKIASNRRVGDPFDRSTQQGPQVGDLYPLWAIATNCHDITQYVTFKCLA